ncbi:EF-P 5-aminopentanol modification-associated protein YfmF [Dysosmobacter sp.]|uniref:EF-P 5-aminopentanol modification-associated protein YfmF n=1 Tax=Dysosmobacter sp. TaxID=2591382 RepID=UPI002A94F530|nr:insulinase family protein [Dysosmobacter sp.]MCI6054046.1 insulinase family protein [Dysosmobacter sp.]MDY5508926.1 insulinase family protein [Dysosmobacter sp.]
MQATRVQLADGVYLTYLPARKFKTSLLSAQFVTPLRQETASAWALLPAVLRRGTVRYPDLETLSAQLDRLYGASVEYTIRKKGENQCVGFVASFIDDSFAPGGEKLLEPAADLVGELICDPVTERGRFVGAYFDSEKTNLIDAIRSQINDKRDYAAARLLQEMCAGEPYGVSRLGDEKTAEKLQMKKLYAQYGELISTARLELFYIGSAQLDRVRRALANAFATLPRDGIRDIAAAAPHPARAEVRTITEELDVTQGKLCMGFTCGSSDHTALLLGNTLFGGSSNSKLFLNVREKLSLCYYASSAYHRQKGLITVSSGIEFADYQRAYDEILRQLEAVQKGRLEDWEMSGARSTLLNAYASMGDSQGKLENFYLGQAATGQTESPEDLAAQLRDVTDERVFRAMETVGLDTVYFLKGKEAAE